jgi:hypothetical protein
MITEFEWAGLAVMVVLGLLGLLGLLVIACLLLFCARQRTYAE